MHAGRHAHARRSLLLFCPCLQVVMGVLYMHAGHYGSYTHACRSLQLLHTNVTYTPACRSLRPAQDAASVLQRYKQEHPTSKLGMQDTHPEREAHADEGQQQQGTGRNWFYLVNGPRADSGGSWRCVHVLAFESVCKQQRSGVEIIILADGVCYALCIQFPCSRFALQQLFDLEGQ